MGISAKEPSIENKEYYDNAKRWYIGRYAKYTLERTFLLSIIVAASFIIHSLLSITDAHAPYQKAIPIVVSVNNQSNSFSVLSPLQTKRRTIQKDDPDKLLVSYLLKRFITSYESYDASNDFLQFKKAKNYISQFAEQRIIDEFVEKFSIQNPSSAILKYRNHTKRTVEVIENSETFSQNFLELILNPEVNRSQQPIRYTVTYVTAEVPSKGQEPEHWRAEIDFLYENVTFNYEKKEFNPLQLSIIGYETYRKN